MKRLLILGDSPTQTTGFGRVIRNLLTRWQAAGAFDDYHVWGIGYHGNPHEFTGVNLWPAAQPGDDRWESQANLTRFASLAESLKPTHVFLLQDLWGVMPLSNVCRDWTAEGVVTVLYFPIDAPPEPCWTRIAASVKHAVAYCEYGRTEICRALRRPEHTEPVGELAEWRTVQRQRAEAASRIRVIPHGVDPVFTPLEPEVRRAARKELFPGGLRDDEFLMVNVSVHQRRKGLTQSLMVLAELRRQGVKDARLYLHCLTENKLEGVHLGVVAAQLGLEPGVDVVFGDRWHKFGKPLLDDDGLRKIYGAADLLLSTSLGEGWGMPVTEAMACGVPVAVPDHTSLTEIVSGRGLLLPLGAMDVVIGDNNRLRPRVNPVEAARKIHLARANKSLEAMGAAGRAWAERLSWGVIARQWLDLFFEP